MRERSRSWGRRRLLLSVVLAAAMVATTSALVYAVTSNNGPFTGCLTPKGDIYAVAISSTTPAGLGCRKGEVQIAFGNAQGLQGIPGIRGVDGVDGIDGIDGIDGEDGLGPVVAAGRVGPLGGLTISPQFGSAGVVVDHLATGIYRLSFLGYDQLHRYVVSGSPVTSLADAPRLIETVVDGGVSPTLDPSLGIYVRISTTGGTAVDSTFTFQVTDFSVAP